MLAVINQKGGVGKTTTAVNVAAILEAEYGKRVLLIDADSQGHATAHMGFNPDDLAGLHDVLIDQTPISEVVVPVRDTKIDLIPAPDDDTDMLMHPIPGRELRLRQALEKVRHNYDEIIIDSGPVLNVTMYNVLAAADRYLVTTLLEGLSVRGLAKLEKAAQTIRTALNPDLHSAGVLCCRVRQNVNLTKDISDALDQFPDLKRLTSAVRENIRLTEAASYGKTILEHAPSSPGADDYRAVTKELFDA